MELSAEATIRETLWKKFWEGYTTGRGHVYTELLAILPTIIQQCSDENKNAANEVAHYIYCKSKEKHGII